MMDVKEFTAKLVNIATFKKTLYVMGCFGAPMTTTNKTRYTANHPYNKKPERVKLIKAATTDVFGFDCVNLIKGILWGWSGDKLSIYGGARYSSNGVPDVDANDMIKLCKNVTTDFSRIVPGAAVWMQDHIGVYVGDGCVVECTPKWDNCVQISMLANNGFTGTKKRTWSKWGLIPWVDYQKEEDDVTEQRVKEIATQAIKEYLNALATKTPDEGSWEADWWKKAIDAGITSNGASPFGLASRVEVSTMILKNGGAK